MNSTCFVFCLGILFGVLTSTGPILAKGGIEENAATSKAKIQNSRTGATLELDELVEALSDSDVIFLGEQHDNDSGHRFQLNTIESLVKAGHSIAICMEQFERDVQGALNDYLSGRLSESEFLKVSRPWKNYAKHYRPIIEFAKQQRIHVIAANIPRGMAANVSKGQRTAFENQVYLPRKTFVDKNEYWERFKATMSGHVGTDGESKLEKYFSSQCLKDDAMAESISDFLAVNSHQKKIVVHLCGHFHSDYGLGTVARVLKRRPLARVHVVTMESRDNASDEKIRSGLKSRSHFVFWTIKNQEVDRASKGNVSESKGK